MTRKEHIDWCKKRALEYVEAGELNQAVTSLLSDLGKHPDTAPLVRAIGMMGLIEGAHGSRDSVRRWIEGFN